LFASKRTVKVLVVIAALSIAGAACSKKAATPGGSPSATSGGGASTLNVNIAFMGDLSSTYKELVSSPYQAAILAFDQFNASQTAVKVTVVPEDTQANPDQAKPLAQKVAADASFVGVIGPAFSGESASSGDILDQAGIPFVTPSATDDALSSHNWTHWFRGVGDNSSEASGAVPYITKVMKPNCTFVASDGSAYGHGLAAIVESQLQAAGASVKPEEQVQPKQPDYSALVAKITSSGCKALFYGGYDADAAVIRKGMDGAGLTDVILVGGDGIQSDTYIKGSGTGAGNGTIAVEPSAAITGSTNPASQKFVSDYTAKWGAAPAIYAGEGWDIAQMYIAAFKAGKTDRQSITTFIHGLQAFPGLTKDYTFQANGELDPAAVVDYIYQVKDGAWIVLGSTKDVIPA
jgi:branched-chain amino acid transport system substrate-binding protein